MCARFLAIAAMVFILVGCGPKAAESPGEPASSGVPSAAPTLRPSSSPTLPTSSIPTDVPITSDLRGRIAYGDRQGHIWVMDADGSERKQITSATSGVDFDPNWLPDGRTIVFRTSRGDYAPDPNGTGTEGIWIVDTTTLKEHQLFPADKSKYGGLFPDPGPGHLIALSTLDADLLEVILLVDARTGDIVRQINVNSSGEACEWSPDGKRIAYTHLNGSYFDIWVMNADGSDQTQLTDTPWHDDLGQWSPDGSQLSFTSPTSNGFNDIWVMNADGSDQTRITSFAESESPGAWLPDGRIVFDSWNPVTDKQTWYVMKVDGTGLASIPAWNQAGVEGPIDWIPSGT
jgi:Tol biopolymer transport system component